MSKYSIQNNDNRLTILFCCLRFMQQHEYIRLLVCWIEQAKFQLLVLSSHIQRLCAIPFFDYMNFLFLRYNLETDDSKLNKLSSLLWDIFLHWGLPSAFLMDVFLYRSNATAILLLYMHLYLSKCLNTPPPLAWTSLIDDSGNAILHYNVFPDIAKSFSVIHMPLIMTNECDLLLKS